MLETNIADSFVKLLQNLNIEEMRQLQDLEYERIKLEYAFKLNSRYIALRAQVDNVRLISFNEAQSHPEYQAELESVRSKSFISSSSTSLSDVDIETYSKMMAFINFTAARDKDLSFDPKPRLLKPMRM